jgi:hypothetical protein
MNWLMLPVVLAAMTLITCLMRYRQAAEARQPL